jgi:beta-1,4-mannosyltransferase
LEFRFSRSVLTDFDVDVVHVLEPHLETLLGTGHGGALQRFLAVKALTRNLRKHRIALVRTLPGVGPSIGNDRSAAQRMLDKATTAFVVFHESTPTPDASRTTVIPHADFRERFSGYPRGEMIKGRVLCVSRGKLSSSSLGLIGMPRATHTPGTTLRMAGEADGQLEQAILSASALHPFRVSARLERLSDGARVQEIDQAELVAVPEVKSMGDLQTVFLALTLDRPVITPRSPLMAALADEAGSRWVHMSDGPITAASADDAFTAVRKRSAESAPSLEGREMSVIVQRYAALFEEAATKRKAAGAPLSAGRPLQRRLSRRSW